MTKRTVVQVGLISSRVYCGAGLALVLGIAIAGGIVGPAVTAWLDRFMVARRWLQGLHVLALAAFGVVLLAG